MRLFLLLLLFAGHAFAQDWPARPVKFIVSQAPGTSPDITARYLADRLSKLWSQPVVVENRPGGQNVPGAQAAARAAPDGYTLLLRHHRGDRLQSATPSRRCPTIRRRTSCRWR